MSIALLLLKKFAPVIAILAVASMIWYDGYRTADAKRIAREAALQAETDALLKQATEANAAKAKQIDESNQHIEATSHANRQIIEDLADHNRELASRVQFSAGGRCRAVSKDAAAPEISNGADTGGGEFFAGVVDIARRADEVVEVARACQQYSASLVSTPQ